MLSPQEKLEALKRIGKMPDGKKRKYDPRIYGPVKAKFLEDLDSALYFRRGNVKS